MEDTNSNEITDLVTNTDKSIEWTDNSDSAKALATTLKRRRQIRFLQAYQDCGTVRGACDAIGIRSSMVRSWRDNDEWFQQQYLDAEQDYADLVGQEVHNRAIVGEQVPIVGRVATPTGIEERIIGYKTVKSDLLLILHAKKVNPKYRDKVPPSENNMPVRESPMVQINVLIDRIAEKVGGTLPSSHTMQQLPPATDDIIDVTPESES